MKALLLTAALLATPALATSPIEGNWTNPKHSVTVRIGPCGGPLCGRVIAASPAAREAAADGGTPRLVGTQLMSDIQPNGQGSWTAEIFVPDVNRRAQGELHLLGPRTLEVQGCALGGMLCKSQVWTRVGGAPARHR